MTDQPRNHAISRRRLLGTGAAASAGAVLGAAPEALAGSATPRHKRRRRADVASSAPGSPD